MSKPKGGRPTRPPRCRIQVYTLQSGKRQSLFSITVGTTPYETMKRIQEAFADCYRKFSRSTDDPRWHAEKKPTGDGSIDDGSLAHVGD